jgi:hypothetical protein
MKVQCIKCGRNGSLTTKTTITKGRSYRYFYVQHSVKGKKSWCFIGKMLPAEYTQMIHKPMLEDTQIETPVLSPISKIKARGVGFEPTRPFDHRLSRPAPYQAWGTPPTINPKHYHIALSYFYCLSLPKA